MQPVVIGAVIWEPSDEVIARSRLKRFMDQHGIETFRELLKRADDDIEWFWDAAIKDIDIAFYRHYDEVVDRRAHEHRPELPRPPPRQRVPRQARRGLGRRAGRRPQAHLRRAGPR